MSISLLYQFQQEQKWTNKYFPDTMTIESFQKKMTLQIFTLSPEQITQNNVILRK
jgi:hypothetical protein